MAEAGASHVARGTAISVVIPTFRREQVLLDTIGYLLLQDPPAAEILVVDQTEEHQRSTMDALQAWNREGKIRWIRLTQPSIPHAMNTGLELASGDVVVFVDDDILPAAHFLSAHALAHREGSCSIVAGQVLQPGEEVLPEPVEDGEFRYCSARRRRVEEFIGCNFSVNRRVALGLGGFDENFVHTAYRFEAEFCDRALTAGERILFEPRASIRHLRVAEGGTRSYGVHLTTVRPSHAVGEYYYLLRARRVRRRYGKMLFRFFRSVRTKHHLRHPWWIPGTWIAEFLGFLWALGLFLRGPRLIGASSRLRGRRE